jgi:hypothetical protein
MGRAAQSSLEGTTSCCHQQQHSSQPGATLSSRLVGILQIGESWNVIFIPKLAVNGAWMLLFDSRARCSTSHRTCSP